MNEILTPREEVIEERFQGTLQAHKISADEDRLETNPKNLFDLTYPSNALRNVLELIDEKLKYKNSQGAAVLTGTYGSGKSHGLIALYYLFKNPDIAKNWLNSWNIDIKNPSDSDSVILSTLETDADLLWKPIFERAEREDLLEKVKRYPETGTIEKLVEDNTLAILLDEIESWYQSMQKDSSEELIERNRVFIQNLLEVANDPNQNLFVFITTLGKGTSLDEIIQRTNPRYIDMSASGDREDIIQHRLFKMSEEKKEGKIREIVSEYVDKYNAPIEIEDEKRYEERMVQSYPFHPQLLNLLDRIYETASQNVRGEMRVLAEVLARKYKDTDLILLSDVNEKAFQGINLDLIRRFRADVEKRVSDIAYGEKLLRSILMYSLDEKSGPANPSDTLLGTYKPTEGMTLTQLDMSLENLVGMAHYLHREDGHYTIKTEENVMALANKEVENIEDTEASNKIAEILKESVFDNRVFIYETEKEDIPDDKEITYVVLGKSYGSDSQLKEELEDFYEGREYQNTIIFVSPRNGGSIKDSSLLDKSKLILAAERLKGKIEDPEEKLQDLQDEEKKEILNEIENQYGYWINWSPETETSVVDIVKRPVSADIDDIKEKIETDKSLLEEKIQESVSGKEEGVKVGHLLRDFKKYRKNPVISNDTTYYNVLRRMCGEKIVIQGDRSKFYRDRAPEEIRDDYVIFEPQFVPETEVSSEEEEKTIETTTEGSGEIPSPEVKEKTQSVSLRAGGNSPRVLLSKFEAQLNEEKDTVSKINLSYLEKNWNKKDLLDMIKNLPEGEKIIAELEVERRED
ncbi:hypothetical protein AKJ36_00090 [candidate division MSBL1 archaeon SCGC-AAA259I07]|uniref:Uncharacterized protein n=1 Tax=candidate division MSBL1 archaeon SCGC-AAA259I07 TaxID=1698266 RepID=A0A133UN72_9EURY|nr:hypothetical protein AKJ36_00090 [candidate division MSBL1 archaeon SCGC-AAA259I07]